MNKEQLDAIKGRFENMQQQARTGFTADISAIEIAFQDVPALIAEVERLREAFLLIQNSDTWLIEPSPTMHTIEEAYHACVGIADKALGGETNGKD